MKKNCIIDNGHTLIDKSRNLQAEMKEFILSSMKEIEKIMVYKHFDDMGEFDDAEEAFEVITSISPIITISEFNIEDCYIVGLDYDKISDTLFVYVTPENDPTFVKSVDFVDVFSDSYISIIEFILNAEPLIVV